MTKLKDLELPKRSTVVGAVAGGLLAGPVGLLIGAGLGMPLPKKPVVQRPPVSLCAQVLIVVFFGVCILAMVL